MDRAGILARAGQWVESAPIQKFIMVLIVLNAIILGLETSRSITDAVGPLLYTLDTIILGVFVIELALRIGYRRLSFFRDGWSVFDFLVVVVALAPASQGLAVLRSLRVLRVLRLITVLPRLKMIVQTLLSSLPGLSMIVLLQGLLFYVGAVMATTLFGNSFPQLFGTLGGSVYTLFQIMTMDSWSSGIVRPIMEQYPYAWTFFIPFVLIATFTMLNLFIAVIVNAMQSLQGEEIREVGEEVRAVAHAETESVMAELKLLRSEIAALRQEIAVRDDAGKTMGEQVTS